MKEIYYTYNNEALASCVLLSVLKHQRDLDIARCCLILPFLLDDRTINYMFNNAENEIELKELVEAQPRLFSSFNKRYLSLLPVTINSLMILKKSEQININDLILYKSNLEDNDYDFGVRYNKIVNMIPRFLDLINRFSTEQLYKIFRIQL